MNQEPRRLIDVLLNPALLLKLLLQYFGFNRGKRLQPVLDRDGLKHFLTTRASFVAQTSLYGYLRTRAGMRYPELFDDDAFVVSINIAKWQIWLACLSDLCVYTGGLLRQHPRTTEHDISRLMQDILTNILEETGVPQEAGHAYTESAEHVRQRLAQCDWQSVSDDETPFCESPQALVQWAPIVEDLKQLDEEIVKNSIRFRWQSVRRDLRSALNPGSVLGLEH